MKNMYKILIFLSILIIIPFSINVDAENFELIGTSDNDKNDYLYINFTDDLELGISFLTHNGQTTILDYSSVKFFKSEGFVLRADGVLIFGHPTKTLADLEYDLTILIKTEKGVEKLKFHTAKIKKPIKPTLKESTIIPLSEYEKSQKLTGLPYIETQKKLEEKQKLLDAEIKRLEDEKNKIPRSKYTLSPEREIAILIETMDRVSIYSFFDFDIRIVDPKLNKLYDYYDTTGYIHNVQINSTIRDGERKILNSFSGNTTTNGHYSPNESTYFAENINTRNAFTLDILATKYFDETETFATTSLFKEFFVYIPSNSDNSAICGEGYTHNAEGKCVDIEDFTNLNSP